MKKLLVLLSVVFLSCSSYKQGPTVSIDNYKQDIFYQGTSDYVVVLIPNIHNSFKCQKQVYRTMEKFLPQTKFVAREWVGFNKDKVVASFHWSFAGPIYFPKFQTWRLVLYNMEDFIQLKKSERIKLVNKWTKECFPEGSLVCFPEGSLVNRPVKAPYLLEATYQDEVKSIGVGDAETNMRAAVAVDMKRKGLISSKKFVSEVLDPRNKSFVKNIQKIVERGDKGNLVLFSVGYFHISGLTKLLRAKKRSYVVIINKDCTK